MPKTKKNLVLNIKREVSDLIRSHLVDMLTQHVRESKEVFGLPASSVFESEYLLKHLLSKYVDENTDPPELLRHRAIVKWLGVEHRNKKTNERLYSTDPLFKGAGYGHEILKHSAKLIAKVLGPYPGSSLFERGSFSGGATTSVKRGVGTLAAKFTGKRDVTPECWRLISSTIDRFDTWVSLSPEAVRPRFVKGNILFTVPKTAVIDRVACKEPDYNIFAQKAVGDYIRNRLRRKARIDLNDQSINRNLAKEASIHRHLATIDLSSASDSLTTGLVALLLPHDWFAALDLLRSPKTFIDGASHTNEMFSSMGNGFTFELESLIFWALAKSITIRSKSYGRVSVYGDDIIVPVGCAGLFIQVLHWVGFKTNVDKTFIKGPFRESCGGHYYGGNDVTPFYLRRPIKDVSDLILFLNQYRRWLLITEMDTVGNGYLTPNQFVKFWYQLAAFVPKSLWGGYDLDSRTQLVSPGPQRCELLRTKRRHAELELAHGIGLYLSRLSELDRRSFPIRDSDVEFSTLTTPTKGWKIRRCKVEPHVFGLVRPLFIHEQLVD